MGVGGGKVVMVWGGASKNNEWKEEWVLFLRSSSLCLRFGGIRRRGLSCLQKDVKNGWISDEESEKRNWL